MRFRGIREAVDNLHRQLTQDNFQAFQAGISWFLEQLGIAADDARELSLNELYERLTPGLLYGLMSRTGESVNARTALRQLEKGSLSLDRVDGPEPIDTTGRFAEESLATAPARLWLVAGGARSLAGLLFVLLEQVGGVGAGEEVENPIG
jgi:hypothetical protein